jgi:hypothetical protein
VIRQEHPRKGTAVSKKYQTTVREVGGVLAFLQIEVACSIMSVLLTWLTFGRWS